MVCIANKVNGKIMWFWNVMQNRVKDLPDYQGITVGLKIVEVLEGADSVSSQSWNHFCPGETAG